MELGVEKDPDLVVALDIGSTHSGYAWQWRGNFKNNRSNVEFNENWGTPSPKLRKTTTCLLLDKEKNILSFGQSAEQSYCDECDSPDGSTLTDQWYFFKFFKMVLYDQSNSSNIKVDDQSGKPLPLVEVMSKFIQALKDHFLKNKRIKQEKVNILWVVTVPAIWSDSSKQLMRDAAMNAGIKRTNLLIANEPEAAAIHCLHLPDEQKLAFGGFGDPGTTFLTVDFGGGTTDVLALRVRDDNKLEEISIGSGDRVGGSDINSAFWQACNDAFVGRIWTEVTQKCHAVELLDMENDFESKKVAIGSDNVGTGRMRLNVPQIFTKLLTSGQIKLKDSYENQGRFSIKGEKMYFSSEFIRETLFNETIRRMLELLEKTLQNEKVHKVKDIVLVGGFTESPIIVEKIKAFLQEKRKNVIVPTSPLSAVLSGAVLYGHDPFIFHSRICRATYGIETNTRFDSTKHSQEKKWKNSEDGLEYCKHVFSVHVEKGSSVRLGEKLPAKSYSTMYKNQTSLVFNIFTSTKQHQTTDTLYTTDEHCKKLGTVTVEMSDTTGGTDRKAIVTMIYGGTELDVTAKNEMSGEEYNATLRFDTS